MNAAKLVSSLRLAIEANNGKISQLEANRHSHSFSADATDLFAAWASVVPMTAEQKAENVEVDSAVDALIARNVRIRSIISKVEFKAAKQVTIVDNTSATSASIKVGTTVFFSECWDEEYGSYKTSSAIVSSINSAVYDDGEVIEFSLSNSRGEYVGSGYAWENGARMFGNGDVYLTADAVPAVNCSSEEINWEEQG